MRRKITFVAIVPELSTRTRCLKMAALAAQDGFEIALWGWDREGMGKPQGEQSAAVCSERKLLVSGGGYSNSRLLPYYVLWVIRVFWQALRHPPGITQALGLESAFPVAVAGLVRRDVKLIFDDADRLSYCHEMPALARKTLSLLERWTMRRSVLHIIPGRARYPDGLNEKRTVVLKNNPSEKAIEASKSIELVPRAPQGVLTLLALGWIGEVRGAALIDGIAELTSNNRKIRFLAAGQLTGDAAHRFVQRANVQYFGEISNEAALSLYRAADLVLTFYDPAIPINRVAEPNKWGDCVQQGVPFLVNSQVITAKEYIDAGCAFTCPYDDPEAARDVIEHLTEQPQALSDARAAILKMRSTQVSFDETYQSQVLAALTGPTGTKSETLQR